MHLLLELHHFNIEREAVHVVAFLVIKERLKLVELLLVVDNLDQDSVQCLRLLRGWQVLSLVSPKEVRCLAKFERRCTELLLIVHDGCSFHPIVLLFKFRVLEIFLGVKTLGLHALGADLTLELAHSSFFNDL